MGAAVSCAGSAIKCSGLKKKMKTVYSKADAAQYIAAGVGVASGVVIRASNDEYINTTVRRVPIQTESSSSGRSGGGWSGGTTVDSGGFSGHSGKF